MGYPAMDYYSAAKRYEDALYVLIGNDVHVKLFREKTVYIKVCRESCQLCKRENKHTDTGALICLEGTCEIALAVSRVGNWMAGG